MAGVIKSDKHANLIPPTEDQGFPSLFRDKLGKTSDLDTILICGSGRSASMSDVPNIYDDRE